MKRPPLFRFGLPYYRPYQIKARKSTRKCLPFLSARRRTVYSNCPLNTAITRGIIRLFLLDNASGEMVPRQVSLLAGGCDLSRAQTTPVTPAFGGKVVFSWF